MIGNLEEAMEKLRNGNYYYEKSHILFNYL